MINTNQSFAKIVLLVVSCFFICCEDENLPEINLIENGNNTFVDKGKIYEFKKLNTYVNHIKNQQLQLRNSSEQDSSYFSVLQHKDVYVFTDSLSTTFTIPILKHQQTNFSFSNLIIKVDQSDHILEQYILNYKPTQNYLNSYTNDWQTPFEGTVEYETLATTQNRSNYTTESSDDCEQEVTMTFCHWPNSDPSEGYHVAGPNCTAAYMWTETYTIDAGCSGGSGSTSGTPIGGDTGGWTGGGIDDGSNTGGSGGRTTTTPLPSDTCDDQSGGNVGLQTLAGCIYEDDPECEKLKTIMNKPIGTNGVIRQMIVSLNSFTSLDYEVAITIDVDNGLHVEDDPSSESGVAYNSNPPKAYTVVSHTHDAYGTDGNGTYSVFSFDDLKYLAETIYNNKIDGTFVATLATHKGTFYAMTINDPSKLLNLFYYKIVDYPTTADEVAKYTTSKEVLYSLDKEYFNKLNPNRKIKVTETNNELTLKHFLKFLELGDAGVTLFETDAQFNNFQPLSLDAMGNVERNLLPCDTQN